MYSQATLDLAKNMNFKALAAMNFEDKYPLVRIQNCVNKVEQLILVKALPFFAANDSVLTIYHQKREAINTAEKLEEISCHFILETKLYAQKLGLFQPEKLNGYTHYIQQFKDGLGYMNKVDFDTLEIRLANYKF